MGGGVPVDSSNIDTIEYLDDTRTLRVKFLSGSIYDYSDVPKSEHDGLMHAESHGKYLHRHIIPEYKATKIT